MFDSIALNEELAVLRAGADYSIAAAKAEGRKLTIDEERANAKRFARIQEIDRLFAERKRWTFLSR